jgi:hypothetical protein
MTVLNITTTADPPSANVSISEMPPVAAAGVKLARFVLWITISSIAGLVLYLFVMEIIVASNVQGGYSVVLNSKPAGAQFYALGQLERFAADLTAASTDPNWQMSDASLRNANAVIGRMESLPDISAGQKAEFKDCVPLPVSADRKEKLDRCGATLAELQQGVVAAAKGSISIQTAGEAADKLLEHRQSLHQFWLQVAQMILLNLLLPVLTALLGYVFGTTQQVQSK